MKPKRMIAIVNDGLHRSAVFRRSECSRENDPYITSQRVAIQEALRIALQDVGFHRDWSHSEVGHQLSCSETLLRSATCPVRFLSVRHSYWLRSARAACKGALEI
jgi:hypothetical protein